MFGAKVAEGTATHFEFSTFFPKFWGFQFFFTSERNKRLGADHFGLSTPSPLT